MMYEEDFISRFEEEFEIDGRMFKLKILKGNEKDEMINFISSIDEAGYIKYDIAKRNKYYLSNCVLDAPYEYESKKWVNLSPNQRYDCLNDLQNAIRGPLIQRIIELNEGLDLKKK